jgi:hypothetical protein
LVYWWSCYHRKIKNKKIRCKTPTHICDDDLVCNFIIHLGIRVYELK